YTTAAARYAAPRSSPSSNSETATSPSVMLVATVRYETVGSRQSCGRRTCTRTAAASSAAPTSRYDQAYRPAASTWPSYASAFTSTAPHHTRPAVASVELRLASPAATVTTPASAQSPVTAT